MNHHFPFLMTFLFQLQPSTLEKIKTQNTVLGPNMDFVTSRLKGAINEDVLLQLIKECSIKKVKLKCQKLLKMVSQLNMLDYFKIRISLCSFPFRWNTQARLMKLPVYSMLQCSLYLQTWLGKVYQILPTQVILLVLIITLTYLRILPFLEVERSRSEIIYFGIW